MTEESAPVRNYLDELYEDETFTEEEARRHFEARLLLPDDPEAIGWLTPKTPPAAVQKTAAEAYEDLRELAFHLVAHRQAEAYEHLTKAATAAFVTGETAEFGVQVELAKAMVPAELLQGIIQNLFSSLGQMLQTTVQQFRSVANPASGSNSLISSLNVGASPNLAGWPTL